MLTGNINDEAVSLTFELTQLQRALLAVENICQTLADARFAPPGDARHAGNDGPASSAVAIIGLVEARLRLLQSAISEELDPKLLLTPWNAVPLVPDDADDPDLRLTPWTPAERLRQARDTVTRLERRLSQTLEGFEQGAKSR